MKQTKTGRPSGIIAHVYRSNLGDCTNGGISSKFDAVTLILDNGGPFEPTDARPAVKLVKRGDYVHAEPVRGGDEDGRTGYMAGGNFIFSHDTRYREAAGLFPVSLHDRTETWANYNTLTT